MMIHLNTSSLTLSLTVIPEWLFIILFLNAYFSTPGLSLLVLFRFTLGSCTLGLILPPDALQLCVNRDPTTTLDIMDLQLVLWTLRRRWVTNFMLPGLTLIIAKDHQWGLGFWGRGEIWVESFLRALLHRGSQGWGMVPQRRQLVKMHLFRSFRRLQVGRPHWSLGFFNFKV